MQALAKPQFPVPVKAGAGFKPDHMAAILADVRKVGFFEVHAENYMGDGGAPHAMLERLRQDYPVFLHGVGMSLGGETQLNVDHMKRFKRVMDRYQPLVVSEHLAWSTHDNSYYNDLLPVPYNAAVLDRVVDHINTFQDFIGRAILLENPSTYVAFNGSTLRETEFLREIVRRTGCGLLLDVNNVYVSAVNHGYGVDRYLAHFPIEHVREIHLAGHATEEDDNGAPLLIDAHDRAVCDEVWKIYADVVSLTGPVPTLIEWDNDIPDWPVLKAEADKADRIMLRHGTDLGLRHAS